MPLIDVVSVLLLQRRDKVVEIFVGCEDRCKERAREWLKREAEWTELDDLFGARFDADGDKVLILRRCQVIGEAPPADPSCYICKGSGRRGLDDAFGQEGTLLAMTEESHTDCFCVVGRWDSGEEYQGSAEYTKRRQEWKV